MIGRRFLRALRALYTVKFAESSAYRAQSALWMLGGLFPLIMWAIWRGIGTDPSYSQRDFALYYLFIFVARQFTPCWAIFVMDREVRKGELSARLMRPLDPLWNLAAEHWGEMSVRIPPVVLLFVLFLFISGYGADVPLRQMPLFLLGLAVGWWLNFSLHYCMAMLVFWTQSVTHFDSLMYRLFGILGGIFTPLEFFPPALAVVLHYLPFPYVMYFPAQLALGRLGPAATLEGFAIALGWIAIFTMLHRILWRLGLRKFAAVGA
ncbi:MAG TPA: ABC-2 family transporter protein [Dongiaceae bacterium]|jgi:ABC-2 type transport system permease protein|nr:ABC-2 family transporter protein [Dongiaceae bacterium]